MANHQRGEFANMRIDWFDWPTVDGTGSSTSGLSLSRRQENLEKILVPGTYCPLDLAYIATRDIAMGEELTFDYGEEWEVSWREHIGEVVQKVLIEPIQKECTTEEASSETPVFRHFIEPPQGMYPDSWNTVKCYGSNC